MQSAGCARRGGSARVGQCTRGGGCTSVGGCNSAAGDGCHPWPGGCIRSGGYTLVTVGGVLVVG